MEHFGMGSSAICTLRVDELAVFGTKGGECSVFQGGDGIGDIGI